MHRKRTTFVIATATGFFSSQALGFCRTTSCEIVPTPSGCLGTYDADGCSNEGIPLHWGTPCLSFSVQRSGTSSSGIDSGTLEQNVELAYATWRAVQCGQSGNPSFLVAKYPQARCDEVGYRGDGPNQNLWVFRDDSWEHEIVAGGALALTTLSVVSSSGEIYDADVELNTKDHAFTVGEDAVETDLFSVVLHESGHVLGVGHSRWATSTMSDSYTKRTLERRELEADDINAICAVLPPGELPAHCDPEPHGGFSSDCSFAHEGCCSIARGRRHSSWFSSVIALLVSATGWRLKRARAHEIRERESGLGAPEWRSLRIGGFHGGLRCRAQLRRRRRRPVNAQRD